MSLLVAIGVRVAPLAPYLFVGFLLELATAADPTVTSRDRLFNLGATAIFWAADVLLGAAVSLAVLRAVWWLPGAGPMTLPLPPRLPIVPTIALAFLWICVSDFFYYWLHRAQHRFAWLWAEHEIHHSDPAMNVTTTWRHHWLEKPLQAVCIVAPVAYLFTPPVPLVAMAGILSNVIVHFIHTNSRVSFGRWNWLVANPHHHRIHHSVEPQHFDKNFAAICPLWDVLFGTYYAPQRGEYPRTGLPSGPRIDTLTAIAVHPFRRWLSGV